MAAAAEAAVAELAALQAAPPPADAPAAAMEIFPVTNTAQVRCGDDSFTVHRDTVEKLNELYLIHSGTEDPELELFPAAVYCMLRRYYTLTDGTAGASFESACPRPLLHTLHDEWDVCFEAFASPLNTFFRNFTSPFPDTDSAFGSMGSFFQLVPRQGSFVVHPARVQEVADRTAAHVNAILSAQPGALSFVIIAPDWSDPPSEGLAALEASPFLRAHFAAPEGGHTFVSGLEHVADGAWDQWRVVPHMGTRVFVLQNDAGAAIWQTLPSRMDALRVLMGAPTLADLRAAEERKVAAEERRVAAEERAAAARLAADKAAAARAETLAAQAAGATVVVEGEVETTGETSERRARESRESGAEESGEEEDAEAEAGAEAMVAGDKTVDHSVEHSAEANGVEAGAAGEALGQEEDNDEDFGEEDAEAAAGAVGDELDEAALDE